MNTAHRRSNHSVHTNLSSVEVLAEAAVVVVVEAAAVAVVVAVAAAAVVVVVVVAVAVVAVAAVVVVVIAAPSLPSFQEAAPPPLPHAEPLDEPGCCSGTTASTSCRREPGRASLSL